MKRWLCSIVLAIAMFASPVAAQVAGPFARVRISTMSLRAGTGTPEGSVTAPVGDVYFRVDTAQIYTKTSGTGNTGWTLIRTTDTLTILTRNATQAITSATWTSISWDTEVQDDSNAFASGTPTIITVPAGYTKVRATVYTTWASSATNGRSARITKNGTADADTVEADMRTAFNESSAHWTSRWLTVAPADTLSIMVYQDSGGSLNLSGSAVFGGPTYVQLEWKP